MHHFNGVALYDHRPQRELVQLDASLLGMGGRWEDYIYKLSFPKGMDGLGIVQFKILNVFLALRVWAPQWSGISVVFECDNEAVVMSCAQVKLRT